MAITLTGTGGLFTRLGKLGKVLYTVNGQQASLVTVFDEISAQYASTLKDRYGQLATQQTGLIRSQTGIIGAIQQLAANTIIDMVEADQPAAARTIDDALREVRRQMIAASATVKACTVSATVAALGTPSGSGVFVTSTKRGDGLVQENMFAETGRLVCVSDSYSGGATAGRESFRYVGESSLGSQQFNYDWPQGSDAQVSLNAVSADQDASTSGNLLTNGDFEGWTGATPALDNWVTSQTWGTDLARNSSSPFRGTYDLKLIAGTGTNTAITQTFDDSTGTNAELRPLTSYAVNMWMKRSGSVSGGVLTVELIDGSGSVINDQQGAANSFTKTLSTLTTSYAAVNGVFRLPQVLPAVVKLRLRLSTALTGADVLLDDVCMTPLVSAYLGGPGLSIFSGLTPFVLSDTWTVAQTNNRGGATYLATFQALFDRLFDMRAKGILLPSDASPTIADTLITA